MKRICVLAIALAACGCHVRNTLYNPVPRSVVAVAPALSEIPEKYKRDPDTPFPTSLISPDCTAVAGKPCLAFIEFDEMGEFWSPDQLKAAIDVIRRSGSAASPPLVISFVHGWKNNASDGWIDPGNPQPPKPWKPSDYEYEARRKNGNVLGFEGELEYLARDVYPNTPIVGIYIGWRGDFISTFWPLSRQLSYFDRERTAIRIPGADMTEALTSIMLETRRARPDATIVMIGHSFGALVLERTLTQATTDYLLRLETGQPQPGGGPAVRADLVVYINSAAAASEGKQMMDVLQRVKAAYPDELRAITGEKPLFLSISSLGDSATRMLMPIGHGPSFLGFFFGGSWRRYKPTDAAGITNQKDYYLSTVAHMKELQSHKLVEVAHADECKNARIVVGGPFKLPNGLRYQVCENPEPHWNDTPYWAMQIPSSIVRDHSGIFTLNFMDLIFQVFQPATLQPRVTVH